MAELKTSFFAVVTSYGVIRRSLLLALGIGATLTLINQRDAIFSGGKLDLVPLSLSFATPFVVISLSQTLAIRRVFSEALGGQFSAGSGEPFHMTALSHGIPGRAVTIAASTGTIVAAIIVVLVFSRGGGLSHVPRARVAQVYGLSLTFSMMSQTIAYRRARARVIDRLRSGATSGGRAAIATRELGRDQERAMGDHVASCRESVARMTTAFDPTAVDGLRADIQFRMTGSEPGVYYLHVEGGTCTFREGEAEAPSLTLDAPSEVWLAITRGELNGTEAFVQGRYRAEGDIGLLMKMPGLFRRRL